jgi:hypothetical protein
MNRKFCVVLATLAIVMFASSAFAGLMVDVKALAGTGYEVSADGKTVTVLPGTTPAINFGIWATVSGTDGVTNEKLQTMAGGVVQTEVIPNASALALADATTKGYKNPFDTQATAAVTISKNLLGVASATSTTGCLNFRAASAIAAPSDPYSWQLGTFLLNAAPGAANGIFSSINWSLPAGGTTAIFTIDGQNKTAGTGAALLSVGAPVTVATVPEPATLVLLGMGALALVFIRRRK